MLLQVVRGRFAVEHGDDGAVGDLCGGQRVDGMGEECGLEEEDVAGVEGHGEAKGGQQKITSARGAVPVCALPSKDEEGGVQLSIVMQVEMELLGLSVGKCEASGDVAEPEELCGLVHPSRLVGHVVQAESSGVKSAGGLAYLEEAFDSVMAPVGGLIQSAHVTLDGGVGDLVHCGTQCQHGLSPLACHSWIGMRLQGVSRDPGRLEL